MLTQKLEARAETAWGQVSGSRPQHRVKVKANSIDLAENWTHDQETARGVAERFGFIGKPSSAATRELSISEEWIGIEEKLVEGWEALKT